MTVHRYVWTRVLFVTISGGFLGYDIGSINGVKDMEGYRETLNIPFNDRENSSNGTETCGSQDDTDTTAILGLIVSILSVGSLIGALVGGVLSDFAGRKPAVMIGAGLVSCGGILHMAAIHLWMVFLSRIISGFGMGILFQVTPLYVAEISPEKLRGRLLSFITIYGTTSALAGFVLNVIVKNFSFGWRISVGVPFVTGTYLALGMLLLPRSPRWLVKRHRDDQALKILIKIYNKDHIRAQSQLEEIQSTVSSAKEPLVQTLKYIAQWKILQRLLLGFFLLFLGRLSGLTYVAYFSVSILCRIGLPGYAASIGLGGVATSAMVLSLLVIDKLGRKPAFLVGAAMMVIFLAVSATLILAFDLESGAASSSYRNSQQRVAGYFVLASICLYMGCASVTAGSTPWIILSEMFPLRVKGLIVSIANTGFWIGLICVNQVSPVLASSPLNISGTLFLYSGFNFISFLFVLLLLPETKDLTLEKIEEIFSKPWSERVNVLYYLRCGCFLDLVSRRSRENRSILVAMDKLSSSSSSLDEENLEQEEQNLIVITAEETDL